MSRVRARNIAVLVIALLGLVGSSLLTACGSSDSLGDPAATAVTVGKVKITNGQVERLAMFYATGQAASDGTGSVPDPGSDQMWAFRALAAQALRDQAVYAILAGRCGKPCSVADKAIDAQIALIRTQQFGGSQAEFKKALDDRGATVDDLKGLLRAQLQEQLLVERQERTVRYTEAQALAYYDKNVKTQFTTPASTNLSHILVATKAEAEALRPQLTAANFAEFARSRSLDAEAKTSGGDLGPVDSPGLIPEIAAAAGTLKPGEISQPLESQFGWHLLTVIQVPAKVTTFDEARAGIITSQRQAARTRAVQAWRDTTVKRLQDSAQFANARLAPEKPAETTTAAPTTSTTRTGATTGTSTTK